MSKRDGRPEQLRLQLQSEYMKQLAAASEGLAFYEVTARALMGEALPTEEKSPVWEEFYRVHFQ